MKVSFWVSTRENNPVKLNSGPGTGKMVKPETVWINYREMLENKV